MIYIVIAVITTAFFLYITQINLEHLRNKSIPQDLASLFTQEEKDKSREYTLAKGRFSRITAITSLVTISLLIVFHFPQRVDEFIGTYTNNPYWHSLGYFAILNSLLFLVNLPETLYSQFVLEARFGFNRSTIKTFLLDTIKEGILSVVLGIPILLALVFFILNLSLWWLWASVFLASVMLVISLVYPLWIAPLFNKFTPLPEGDLRDRILKLAKDCHFPLQGVFIMDGSRRSAHSNAYFTGFGNLKRIVLFDTLVESLTTEEIEAVMAHEIGHQKKGHVKKMLTFNLLLVILAFGVAGWLYQQPEVFSHLGLGQSSPWALLLFLTLYLGPLNILISYVFYGFSRRFEYEADNYGRKAIGSGEPLIQALIKLTKENASNLNPHPLYSRFFYSHPTLAERMAALRS